MLVHFMENKADNLHEMSSHLVSLDKRQNLKMSTAMFVGIRVRDAYFVCVGALHPSREFFSHAGTISCLPGWNQY